MAEDDQDAKLIVAFLAKQGATKLPAGVARGADSGRWRDAARRNAAVGVASLQADAARTARQHKRPYRGHRKTDPH